MTRQQCGGRRHITALTALLALQRCADDDVQQLARIIVAQRENLARQTSFTPPDTLSKRDQAAAE